MTVQKIEAFKAQDGAIFEDENEAGKHDLAIDAGTSTDNIGLLVSMIGRITGPDVVSALHAALKGEPAQPAEEVIANLSRLFGIARTSSNPATSEARHEPAAGQAAEKVIPPIPPLEEVDVFAHDPEKPAPRRPIV